MKLSKLFADMNMIYLVSRISYSRQWKGFTSYTH